MRNRHEYWQEYYIKNKEKILTKNRRWARLNKPYKYKLKVRATPKERLLRKISKIGECWEWKGCRYKSGYGRITIREFGAQQYAHRIAFEVWKGKNPNGFFVCHSCDNPPCINPKHLWLGTAKDNASDRDKKGRNRYAQKDT